MVRSPHATRLTMFGVRNPDNRKRISIKRPRMGGKLHPESKFDPSDAQIRHYEAFLKACA